jgi:hypothetical protein
MHSASAGKSKRHRNFFVASVRTADAAEWEALVTAGPATARPYSLGGIGLLYGMLAPSRSP